METGARSLQNSGVGRRRSADLRQARALSTLILKDARTLEALKLPNESTNRAAEFTLSGADVLPDVELSNECVRAGGPFVFQPGAPSEFGARLYLACGGADSRT